MFYNERDSCYIRLKELARQVSKGVILEIGSRRGASAHAMASVTKVPIYCIDLWDLSIPGDKRHGIHTNISNYPDFIKHTKRFDVTPIKGLSSEIAKVWSKPIGLLFIDGEHSYKGCKIDYEGFSKHIVSGGFLVFHDYLPKSKKYKGVEQVVNEVKEQPIWHTWEVVGTTISARRKRDSFFTRLLSKLEGSSNFIIGQDFRYI